MVTGETAKAISKQPKRIKHVPKRTCIGCREIKAKRELIRIVRTSQGNVEVDLTGKKSGRGAYLCHQEACWDMGLKKNRLDYALHTTISDRDRNQLLEFGTSIFTPLKGNKADGPSMR